MFATAPAPEVPTTHITRALSQAGVHGVEVTERASGYDYVGTRDGNVGVTWYRRTRASGPALVFELDVDGNSVSDAADTAPELISLLNRALAEPNYFDDAAR